MKIEIRKLTELHEGDGSELRRQFILAGLLLTVFERFRKYVVDQVDGFFAVNMKIEEGQIVYKRGQEFINLIKERGNPVGRQHGNKQFRAALNWFLKFDAISEVEFYEIERLYILRNEIGHELFEIVADDRKKPLTSFDVLIVFDVYLKIVRWWIKEIELSTDPDLSAEEYESLELGKIESADTVFLREIILKALANDPEFQSALEELKVK